MFTVASSLGGHDNVVVCALSDRARSVKERLVAAITTAVAALRGERGRECGGLGAL